MDKILNIEKYKKCFCGPGEYYILFGETGSINISVDSWEELIDKFNKHLKKCPRSSGTVHCITKIEKV